MRVILLVIIFYQSISANIKPDFNIILHFQDTEDAEDTTAELANEMETDVLNKNSPLIECKLTVNVIIIVGVKE